MNMVRKALGPRSKYNKDLPYTYMAKIFSIEGDDETAHCQFSDTICGLIEFLEENYIAPDEVELYGCYLEKEILLDKTPCLSDDGNWLMRPLLCRALEIHYQKTMDERYKGHVELDDCLFDDRDRKIF